MSLEFCVECIGFSMTWYFVFQVLSAFEDVSLQSLLNRIKEKHNLQTVKKVSDVLFF